MSAKIQVSGTWKSVSALKVKVGGTWKSVTQAYVKTAGEWKQWFSTGIVDTFSRTTASNLGTSESSIAWASRFGTWTANGSTAVSSTAVSSGTAGALSYVPLNSQNALTSVSTPNAGVGPAFWVTSAGSWWAAHLTSDQTNTTYTYNCNCTCNGHSEPVCNSCYNSGFGTTTQRAYYGATTYQSTTVDTSSWVQTSGSPVVSTYNYTHAYFNTRTCTCPSGQYYLNASGSDRCYQNQTVVDTIATCYQSYGTGTVNSSQPCTSCTYNGTFLGCCETGTSGAYRGCRGYTTKTVSVDMGAASCSWDSCSPEYSCPSASDACCYRSVATYASTCSDGSTYRLGGCYNYVTSSAQTCPNGGVLWQESGSTSCASCPALGSYGPGTLSYSFASPTCYVDYQSPNYGSSCSLCGSTLTFFSGGTANPSTGAGCDSYGFTCQTCTGGSITNNYYLQIIYSTAGSTAYTVYSTSSMLASQPTSIQVSTANNTATITPYNSTTSLGNFTATNVNSKGTATGIVKAYAGIVNQATTVDNFSSVALDIPIVTNTSWSNSGWTFPTFSHSSISATLGTSVSFTNSSYITSLNADGSNSWSKQLSGGAVQTVYDVAGNLYVVRSNSAIIKLNSSGNIVWQKTINSWVDGSSVTHTPVIYGIDVDPSGNVYLSSGSNVDNGVYVYKLSSTGAFTWGVRLDSYQGSLFIPSYVSYDATSNKVYVGSRYGDFINNYYSARIHTLNAATGVGLAGAATLSYSTNIGNNNSPVETDGSGNVYGATCQYKGANISTYTIQKLSSSLTSVWRRTVELTVASSSPISITVDKDKNVYGVHASYIFKWNSSGTLLWQRQFSTGIKGFSVDVYGYMYVTSGGVILRLPQDGSFLGTSQGVTVSSTGFVERAALVGTLTDGYTVDVYNVTSGSDDATAWTRGSSDAAFTVTDFTPTTTFAAITQPSLAATVEYLVVAGGGGGGGIYTDAGYSGGAGGAGGLLTGSTTTLTSNTAYAVSVGASGTFGGQNAGQGVNGKNSTFGSILSYGGGGGGKGPGPFGSSPATAGSSGGSGGGGGAGAAGGAGTAGQGYAGGAGSTPGGIAGGAGGGAGGAPTGTYNTTAGAGIASSITGAAVTYAAGGVLGGGATPTANTGNGGFGGNSNYPNGGTAAAGVVVIAYPNTFPALVIGAGLTYDQPTRSGYRVYRFTAGSGNVSW